MTEFEKGARYNSTQTAWESIWDGASMAVELEAVRSKRAQETIQAYLPYLDTDSPILEAGSGLSAVIIDLKQKGYEVIGLDYAVNALQVSRRYDNTLKLIGGDIHNLPHADNSIGAYLSFGVLEHFEHGMQPALREAYRILQPNGILVLTIPYPNVVYKLVQWRRNRNGSGGLTDDEFYESTYTRDELRRDVTAVGFEVLKMQPTSHAFTLWGLGGVFQADGYYKTSALADALGSVLKRILPWQFNFMTLTIVRKPA